MFLLVTGASGSGKSTARRLAEPHLPPTVVCAELFEIVEIPQYPDHSWRQQSTEHAVQYALELQRSGKHLLLSGDPVAIGEVLAAPSATRLEGISACLLDIAPDEQATRLEARGDDLELLPNHHGFAEWMRNHVRDPQHRQFVIVDGGWDEMHWQRWINWPTGDPRWTFAEIDTTNLAPPVVAEGLVQWVQSVLSGEVQALNGAWWH